MTETFIPRPRDIRIGSRHLRVGGPVHRPFWGVERCEFQNGVIWRVSLWPMVTGFFVVFWDESR